MSDVQTIQARRNLAAAIGIVALTYAANWFFNHTALGVGVKSREGAYVYAFFFPFGVVLPALFLGWVTGAGLVPPRRLGARLGWRDVGATAAALGVGALLAAAPVGPLLREPGGVVATHRLFALLLVPSTAEVLVFIGVLANAVHLAAGGAGHTRSRLIALAGSSLAFGFFHLTYPAPWNTIGTCLGLTLVWAGVAVVFFLSRSLVAAVGFNNILAVVGFSQSGIELPGSAFGGWFRAALAFAVVVLVFRLAWAAAGGPNPALQRTGCSPRSPAGR